MRKHFLGIFLLIFFQLFLACSYTDRIPELPEKSLGESEVAGVKSWYLQTVSAPRSFKNLYRVRQDSPKTSYRYAAVYKAPDSFRLEMFPDAGFYSLGLFVADKGRTVFIDQNEKKALLGSDTREFFQEVFGLPVAGGDLPSILTGQLPARLVSDPVYSWYRLPDGNLAVTNESLTEYWELSASSGLLKRVQLRDSVRERLLVEIQYTQYGTIDGILMPIACTLEVPLAGVTLELARLQGVVNKKVASHLFTPEVPSSYSIEQR